MLKTVVKYLKTKLDPKQFIWGSEVVYWKIATSHKTRERSQKADALNRAFIVFKESDITAEQQVLTPGSEQEFLRSESEKEAW